MKNTCAVTCSIFVLAGCAAFGFIDNESFVSLLKQGRCEDANMMIARSNFGTSAERWSYMGQLEYFCYKNREEGIRLLQRAASHGDHWAMTTLARVGERLPEDISPGYGGRPSTSVDVYIHK